MSSNNEIDFKLDLIEMNLKHGRPLEDEDDIQFTKDIIKSFHTLWKLLKQYPKFATEFDSDQFRRIFIDMSSDFKTTPMKNDDNHDHDDESKIVNCVVDKRSSDEFQSVMSSGVKGHVEGRVHQKIFDVVGKIYMSSNSKMSNNRGRIPSSSVEVKSTSDGDDQIRREEAGNDTFCGVCNVELDKVDERDHRCGPLRALKGKTTVELESKKKGKSPGVKVRKHSLDSDRRKSKTCLFSASNIQNEGANMKQIPSEIQKIYHSNSTLRLSYFFQKTCIFRSSAYPKYFTCGLCNIDTIDEEKTFYHFLENSHKTRVAEIINECDMKSVSFEVAILSGNKLKNSRKCFLCNVRLPENDPKGYNTHLQTLDHQKRVKAHFKSRRFQEWEKGIVFRNGEPYCIFCESSLPTASVMYEHVSGIDHMRNLK